SIIANGPFAEDASIRALSRPQCGFGVHLNITEFAPLLHSSDVQPLPTAAGEFLPDISRRKRAIGRFKRAIYNEWCAQIAFCQARGLKLDHLDSHHHVHMIAALLPALKQLQRRYRINRVRNCRTVSDFHRRISTYMAVRQKLWVAAVRADGTKMDDAAGTLTQIRTAFEVGSLQQFDLRGRSIEIYVHPGADRCAEYRAEIELLRSGWLNRALHPLPIANSRLRAQVVQT